MSPTESTTLVKAPSTLAELSVYTQVTARVSRANTTAARAGVRCTGCDLPSAGGSTLSWPMANAILDPATRAVWVAPTIDSRTAAIITLSHGEPATEPAM